MKHFTSIKDVSSLDSLIKTAFQIKKKPSGFSTLGQGKSICAIFFNPSLRTRLSTQRAASNLGMNCTTLDINAKSWKIESQDGVVMNGDKAEHIKEAASVIGAYYDIVAIRSFPMLENKEVDYSDKTLQQFIKYCGKPIISLESCVRHPLQSLADVITIEDYKKTPKPKIVLTWAPHPKALPQAVPNSFAEWMVAMGYNFTITHPEGYELKEEFSNKAQIEYNQEKAFENADFIYAKNWSSYQDYGSVLSNDPKWIVNSEKMKLTHDAKFMHCLPVRRNVVVSDDVIDSANSIVIDQAVNRIVAAQTVMKEMLEKNFT